MCSLNGASADDPKPGDTKQGKVGNCWLMSAFACLASVRGGVPGCFVTKCYSTYGKYRMRLFNQVADKWRVITVSNRCAAAMRV